MGLTVRPDNRLLVENAKGEIVATDELTGAELEAVGVLRAFAEAWQDPKEKAQEKAIKIAIEHASEAEIEDLKQVIEVWESGKHVRADQIRLYGGSIYICVQKHVTQDDWAPPDTPALWRKHTRTTEGAEVAEWVQPQGAHDAYNKDDQVTYEGQVWVSDFDGNIWAPGTHGWRLNNG